MVTLSPFFRFRIDKMRPFSSTPFALSLKLASVFSPMKPPKREQSISTFSMLKLYIWRLLPLLTVNPRSPPRVMLASVFSPLKSYTSCASAAHAPMAMSRVVKNVKILFVIYCCRVYLDFRLQSYTK